MIQEKQDIQKLVFPAGIGYDKQNDRVRTFRTNTIFAAIPLLTRDLEKQKSGKPINFDRFSARVTSEVEKSNFYKDLERVKDWEFTASSKSKKSV
jgi:hypothetical protein